MVQCNVDWREYVLEQLGLVDPCARDILADHIDIAFCLFAHLACGDEFLNSLYAKRYLLSVLIARFTSAVDYYVSQARDIGRYLRTTESESNAQSESAAQSSRRADTTATSREDSFARSEARSYSEDYTVGQSSSSQSTVADDIGSGASQSTARGQQSERSDTADDSTSASDGRSRTTGFDVSAALSTGHSGGRSTAEFFSVTTTSFDGSSDGLSEASSTQSASNEAGYTVGNYLSESSESDSANASSFSYFNELSDSVSQSNSASSLTGRGQTDAESIQRDNSRGFGIAESRSTTQQSMRYDAESEAQSRTDIEGTTTTNQEVFAKDLSDITKHLHWMYDNNERDIQAYVAARNKMIFASAFLQRTVEAQKCWQITYIPKLLKHDWLNAVCER
jgi:hypothetical protein